MEEPKVPEINDLAHHNQDLDLSAATWQPQAITPAYQTWASSQWMAARLLVSGDVAQNPGPPTNNKQKVTNKSSTNTPTYVCSICNKQITDNQFSFLCHHPISNHGWVHKKCTATLIRDYNDSWTCPSHLQNINAPPQLTQLHSLKTYLQHDPNPKHTHLLAKHLIT